jgi:hypothetical protein
VAFVRYADDVRLLSRTPAGARKALKGTEEVLSELGLRLVGFHIKLTKSF